MRIYDSVVVRIDPGSMRINEHTQRDTEARNMSPAMRAPKYGAVHNGPVCMDLAFELQITAMQGDQLYPMFLVNEVSAVRLEPGNQNFDFNGT